MLSDELAGLFNLIKLLEFVLRSVFLHSDVRDSLKYNFRAATERISHVNRIRFKTD